MIEIRWHGRGGQGAKTGSQILAEAAFSMGKYVQAFPEYGSERTGAPMKAFTRIDDDPILIHSAIENPDVIVIIDDTLVDIEAVKEGLRKGVKVLVNSEKSKEELQKYFPDTELFLVPATKISMETLGANFPNTPVLGAIAKITGTVTLDALIDSFKEKMEKKFGEDVINKNISSIKRGFEEVH
jgi:pyruvate ferredoxin oxidoreductase gamma subunit